MGGGDDKGTHLGTGPCQLMKVQARATKDLPRAALFGKCEGVFLRGLALFSVSGPSRRIICRKGGWSVQCVAWHLVREDTLHRGTGGEHLCPGTAYHARHIVSNLEVRFLTTILSLLTRLSLPVPRDTTYVCDLCKYHVSYTPHTRGPADSCRLPRRVLGTQGSSRVMWLPGSP